jgi:hypothetical protein
MTAFAAFLALALAILLAASRRRWTFLATALAFVVLGPALAFADTAATPAPSIPCGDWIAATLASLRDIIVAIAIAAAAVARWAPEAIRQYLTDQVLGRAIDYGIAAVEGATRGQVLNLLQLEGVLG